MNSRQSVNVRVRSSAAPGVALTTLVVRRHRPGQAEDVEGLVCRRAELKLSREGVGTTGGNFLVVQRRRVQTSSFQLRVRGSSSRFALIFVYILISPNQEGGGISLKESGSGSSPIQCGKIK